MESVWQSRCIQIYFGVLNGLVSMLCSLKRGYKYERERSQQIYTNYIFVFQILGFNAIQNYLILKLKFNHCTLYKLLSTNQMIRLSPSSVLSIIFRYSSHHLIINHYHHHSSPLSPHSHSMESKISFCYEQLLGFRAKQFAYVN